jgi:DNA-directed RNA polymerase subunit RPC12/RpoP
MRIVYNESTGKVSTFRYKIWFRTLDENGEVIGEGVYHKSYVHYGNAYNVATKLYGDKTKFRFYICHRNPWLEYEEPYQCMVCGSKFVAPVTADGDPLVASIYTSERMWVDNPPPVGNTFRSRGRNFRHVCPDCFRRVFDLIESIQKEKNNDRSQN